jgi:salicylate hydroxylase
LEAGITVLLGSPIASVNENGPTVLLEDGRSMKADLVVGADGIRSRCRKSILKDHDVEAMDSPNCAYRATVPGEVMNSDPVIAHLMTDTDSNLWMGHERHVIGYPIRNGELYNLVMSHPGKASVGKWNEPGNPDEMRAQYSNWDPIIQRVLTHVTHCLKWKLAYLPPLEKWVSDNGQVVVIGDAAHGMVPYLAQGAAVSIEDGVSLAACVDRAEDISDLSKLLLAFQAIRKPRCETVSGSALENGDIWHMPDGPEQKQRDHEMRRKMDGTLESNENPNIWNNKAFATWLFGYDTEKEVSNWIPST